MKSRLIGWLAAAGLMLCVSCSMLVSNPKGGMRTVPGVEMNELEKVYQPRRMALVVGINDFDDPQWRDLKYAKKDALVLSSILMNPSQGSFDEVIVLTTPELTTKASIMDAIDYINRINTNPIDTVVIYFSTHGTLEHDSQGNLRQYLVASDTKMDDIQHTAIDLDSLKLRFKQLSSARKLLILATCHSGSGKSGLNPEMSEELHRVKAGFFVKPLDVVSEASVILSACAWGETAQEDERLGHDIYTHFFIKALTDFDPNADGATTVSEAHDYAREKTYYYTRGKQRPTVQSDIMGADPIVLTGSVKRTGKPALYSYNDSMNDVEVYVNGTPKGKLPGSFIIEPGVQQISFRKPGDQKRFFSSRVRFSMGERVDAVELIKTSNVDQTVGVGVSYRGFISPDINESVYLPMFMYGMAYGKAGPWRNTRLEMGVYGGNASGPLDIDGVEVDGDFTRVDLDGAFLLEHSRGKLRLAGGPAIGILYLDRRLPQEVDAGADSGVTGSMALTGNIEFTVLPRWILGLGGEVGAAYLVVDSAGRVEMGHATTMYIKLKM